MKKKNISLIVFDMDGTLIDTNENIVSSLSVALSFYNIQALVDEQKIKSFMGKNLQDTLALIIPEDQKKLINNVAQYYVKYYYDNFVGKAKAYTNVLDVLKKIKSLGIKTAVATTKYTECAIRELEGANLCSYIDIIKGTDAGIPYKPDPYLYYDICSKLLIEPETSVMTGDTGTDIKFGNNVNALTVAVTYGAWSRQRFMDEKITPDVFIDDIQELIQIVA